MKKAVCLILLFAILTASFISCSDNEEPALETYDFIAMDTVFSIQAAPLKSESGDGEKDSLSECEKLIADIESSLSRTHEDSDVLNFNKDVNALFDADPVFIDVLTLAMDIANRTDGAYDPTVGSLTSLWNVKGGGPVPEKSAIDASLAVTGKDLIDIKDNAVYKENPALQLDLGGIGKGYAAQKLVEHLHESDFSYGIVSAGRTVGVFGEKPDGSKFKIGIADPFNSEGVVGYLYTDSGFVSVAGDYEQYFEQDGKKYHHIIDPTTGYPSDSGLTSVAVFSQNGAIADALSTALLVMGYDRSVEFCKSTDLSFEAVFICEDGTIKKTDGLTSERFEMSETYKTAVTTVNTDSAKTSENKD